MALDKYKIQLLWLPNLLLIPLMIMWCLYTFGVNIDYWTAFWLNAFIRYIIDPYEISIGVTKNDS